MKRNIYSSLRHSLAALLLLAAAAACSDETGNDIPLPGDIPSGNTGNLVTVRFASATDTASSGQTPPPTRTASGGDFSCRERTAPEVPATRTSLSGNDVLWDTSDAVGIHVMTSGMLMLPCNKKYVATTAATTTGFHPADNQEMQLSPGTYTFYSYYPYQEIGTESSDVTFTLGNFTQSAAGNTDHIGPQDFMYAQAPDVRVDNGEDPEVTFAYHHAFPMLRIKNTTDHPLIRIRVRSETQAVKGTVTISKDRSITPPAAGDKTIWVGFLTDLQPGETGSLLLLPQPGGTTITIGGQATDLSIVEIVKTTPAEGLVGGKVYDTDFKGSTIYAPPAKDVDWTYQIDDEAGLRWLAKSVNHYGMGYVNVALTDNITFTEDSPQWEPIGTAEAPYFGTFDGGGYKVSEEEYFEEFTGFFGWLKNAEVRNLCVSIKCRGNGETGGIAGYADNSTITTCIYTGDILNGKDGGGIVGYAVNCTISACFTSGRIKSTGSRIGDIVGTNSGGHIINCYSSMNVTAGSEDSGGIVGDNKDGTVSYCYATGNIRAKGWAGGIASDNSGSITNSLALSLEIALLPTAVGEGKFSAGRVARNGAIINCGAYADMDVLFTPTDNANEKDGKPLTAAECVTAATYTDTFGFDPSVWVFDTGTPWVYMPRLRVLEEYWGTDACISVPSYSEQP